MSKKMKDPWVRMINVSDPVLHKKGYTLYKVTSKVFPKNSVEAITEVIVWKRYNDFKKLHKALHTIHQNLHLKGTFPPFAKARFFGRFDDSVIEERRQSALNLLQFANNYPPLFTSQVFVKFFEDGHSVDNCLPPSEDRGVNADCILPEKFLYGTRIPNSAPCNSTDKSPENGVKSSKNSLGGTWQHRQVADSISLSSHCTEDDEDDRTTFTDDDSAVYRPSFDLSEFDPLLETNNINSSLTNPVSNESNISDNWLLSALQSCSNQMAEKDIEGVLEFPTPFDEMEYGEIATPSNEYPFLTKTESNSATHFTFDLMPSTQKNPSENNEIDSLTNKNTDVRDSEVSVYNCDDFATTPTSLKNENKCQPSFILHASKYVVRAQEAESNSNYEEAFENYKRAIDMLLQGIQKNDFPDLRDAVRKKVLLYLMRAEEIYENKLPKKSDQKFKENMQFGINPSNKISSMQGCIQDLNKYKVLGILGKVLLVLDISTNSTYVVKTLYKSSVPKTFNIPHIVPQNIPFMVKLHHIYETSYAIFLILEHAIGGKLWDYVSSYLQRSPLSPGNDGAYIYIEPKSKAEHSNVYSGKKVSTKDKTDNSVNTPSVDSDLTPSENCPPSYVALFRRYAAAVNKEDNVALAKYNKIPKVPYTDKTDSIHEKEFSLSQNEDPVSTLQASCDKEKEETRSVKNQHKNSRNRLSSSTGSLETAISQKTCLLDAFNALDDAINNSSSRPTHLPESCVHLWAAEIIVALEALHNLGITWMDFHPDNILLGAEGHILLTYQSKWSNVDFFVKENAKEDLFCAPEVGNIFPVTVDCDWWTLGVILFELLTGRSLVSCHPTGITRHTTLNFPSDVSTDAKDFVTKLLQYNPSERLGSGIYGVEELKSHPFFRTVDWDSLYQS